MRYVPYAKIVFILRLLLISFKCGCLMPLHRPKYKFENSCYEIGNYWGLDIQLFLCFCYVLLSLDIIPFIIITNV